MHINRISVDETALCKVPKFNKQIFCLIQHYYYSPKKIGPITISVQVIQILYKYLCPILNILWNVNV